MGYRLWDPESRKVIHSNDVYFNEAKFHAKLEKIEEIRRVVFQEDEPSTSRQPIIVQDEQRVRVEQEAVVEPPIL